MGAAILFTSLQLWLAEPYHVVQRKLPMYTTWYGHCHLVSGGPGYVWLAEPYVVPLESSAAPKHGIWLKCCFIYLHNTDTNMLCRLFHDRKYTSPYFMNTAILENKNSLYFSASTCEHLWPSPSNLVNCVKCSHNSTKDATDWSVDADFKSLLNFNFFFF